jgi:hypothetical protein
VGLELSTFVVVALVELSAVSAANGLTRTCVVDIGGGAYLFWPKRDDRIGISTSALELMSVVAGDVVGGTLVALLP